MINRYAQYPEFTNYEHNTTVQQLIKSSTYQKMEIRTAAQQAYRMVT